MSAQLIHRTKVLPQHHVSKFVNTRADLQQAVRNMLDVYVNHREGGVVWMRLKSLTSANGEPLMKSMKIKTPQRFKM